MDKLDMTPDLRNCENIGYSYKMGTAVSLLTKEHYSGIVGFQTLTDKSKVNRVDVDSQLILTVRKAHKKLRPPDQDSPDTKYYLNIDGVCTDLPMEVHAGNAFVLPNGFRD